MASTRKRSGRRGGPSSLTVIGVVAAVVVFVGGVTGILVTSSRPSTTGGGGSSVALSTDTSALQPTGEVSSMGLPVVETPGFTSGVAHVGPITVQGANWAMGRVPLNVAVRPFWTLTNTGNTKVTLGKPQAQVREGCCAGPLVLGTHKLAPGQSTVLTFELAMHEGMDGWHDMGVYVPIDGTQWLELNVTGDFRN